MPAANPLGVISERRLFFGDDRDGKTISSGVQAMLSKYDFVSTSVGALSVTTFCVTVGHQDPVRALQVTVSSIIIGLVLNELIFEDATTTRD
uniref:Uncharacterized protein n=1 Tax=Tetraselmis sp. GSL018 TaxID=582737 RepID=A0A061RBR5_9CHLO